MANKWINYVYNETDYRRGDLAVAQKLADAAGSVSDKCNMKIETIARFTRLSERQVKRIIKALEVDGFLIVRRNIGRGNYPEFTLKKMTSTTPFRDRKPGITSKEKVTLEDIIGDIPCIKKVTLDAAVYNEEPFKEPLKNPPQEKPEKPQDNPELIAFRNTLSTFQNEYAAPPTKGLAIANANAIRHLFKLSRGDTSVCIEAHLAFQAEAFRNGRVDWTTVHKNFNFYLASKKNGTDRKYITKQTPGDIIENRPYR